MAHILLQFCRRALTLGQLAPERHLLGREVGQHGAVVGEVDAQKLHIENSLKAINDKIEVEQQELKQFQDDMNAEELGLKLKATHSGKRNKGERYLYAQRGAARANEKIATLQRELNSLTDSLSGIVVPEVAPMDSALISQSSGITVLRERIATLQANVDGRVNRLVRADPDFVPLEDGLLIRIQAFSKILSQSIIWAQVLAVHFLIMLLEMGGLLTKWFLGKSGDYAMGSACDTNLANAKRYTHYLQSLADTTQAAATYHKSMDASREELRRAHQRSKNEDLASQVFSDELADMRKRAANN